VAHVTGASAKRARIVIVHRYAARVLIVFNPAAGAGRQRRLARALAVLRERGVAPEVAETRGPGDAEVIARDAATRGVGVVVAAGGDGTIAEVASGLAGSASALGVLPLGTANVLAWELGLPPAPERAAAVVAAGRAAVLRPGLARFGDGRTRLFVQMLGAGFDAAVVERLDLRLKRWTGRGAYVWQSLRELPRYPFLPIGVVLDGVPGGTVASAIITKGRLYAGRFRIAPAARPAEPGFQAVLFDRPGAWRAAVAGATLPLGLIPHLPGVRIVAARRVRLTGADVPVQADGDPVGRLPVEVSDADGPLRILLPEG